ncbi:MAG: glycosyltransferase WbuB, partial [Cyclobacteriaceae bacterium]|nr:glycosyltransferase WbuB [Cyclobacteriaceae bacterium]
MKVFDILTQYYPPETGAPQNRLHSLATFLTKRGYKVRVFTAMPNYPQNKIYPGYRNKWIIREVKDGILVYRSWIYVSGSRSVLSR